MIEIKRGLDLPIAGEPTEEIDESKGVSSVALVGDDYVGLKPSLAVHEGDRVKLGELLFRDKATPDVQFTSPGAGLVTAIHRGAKRRFLSIEIQLEGEEEVEFASLGDRHPAALPREAVVENLLQSGLWTSFRTRPFSRVPQADAAPRSIFVQAIDTRPLATAPAPLIRDQLDSFRRGLQLLTRLTDGTVYLCIRDGDDLDIAEEGVHVEAFRGPHPAGLPGTHIHFLDPVSANKTVWTIHYQDVIAVGQLFATGRLPVGRIVSLGGPAVARPRLLRTRVGADVLSLVESELKEADGAARVISGSVLSGRQAVGPERHLGRHHWQVSAIRETDQRVLLEFLRPGTNRFSVKNVFASAFGRRRRFAFSTSQEGSPRSMVPIGMYEQVMPLDILPTILLRSLIVGDTDQAQALGCLELDEEDLALCSFVCPGKYEYGPLLRQCLRQIEEEG